MISIMYLIFLVVLFSKNFEVVAIQLNKTDLRGSSHQSIETINHRNTLHTLFDWSTIPASGGGLLLAATEKTLQNNKRIASDVKSKDNVICVTPALAPTPMFASSFSFQFSGATILTSTPTAIPTIQPTFDPTPIPTNYPTVSPTATPKVTPTDYPTESPTATPTVTPTDYPTMSPTATPTVAQTIVPSTSPSGQQVCIPLSMYSECLAQCCASTSPPTYSYSYVSSGYSHVLSSVSNSMSHHYFSSFSLSSNSGGSSGGSLLYVSSNNIHISLSFMMTSVL